MFTGAMFNPLSCYFSISSYCHSESQCHVTATVKSETGNGPHHGGRLSDHIDDAAAFVDRHVRLVQDVNTGIQDVLIKLPGGRR